MRSPFRPAPRSSGLCVRAQAQVHAVTYATTRSRVPTVCAPSATPGHVPLNFKLPYKAAYGQRLCLVGGHEELGSWVVQQGVPMKWNSGDIWSATVLVPAGSSFEYKYVVVDAAFQEVRWQEGQNGSFDVMQAVRQFSSAALPGVTLHEQGQWRHSSSEQGAAALLSGLEVQDTWCRTAQSIQFLDAFGSASGKKRTSNNGAGNRSSRSSSDGSGAASGHSRSSSDGSAAGQHASKRQAREAKMAERKEALVEGDKLREKEQDLVYATAAVTPVAEATIPAAVSADTDIPMSAGIESVHVTSEAAKPAGRSYSLVTELLLAAAAAASGVKRPAAVPPAAESAASQQHKPQPVVHHAVAQSPEHAAIQQPNKQDNLEPAINIVMDWSVQQPHEPLSSAGVYADSSIPYCPVKQLPAYSVSYMHSPYELDIYTIAHEQVQQRMLPGPPSPAAPAPPATPMPSVMWPVAEQQQQQAVPHLMQPLVAAVQQLEPLSADELLTPPHLPHAPFPTPEPLGLNSFESVTAVAAAAQAAAASQPLFHAGDTGWPAKASPKPRVRRIKTRSVVPVRGRHHSSMTPVQPRKDTPTFVTVNPLFQSNVVPLTSSDALAGAMHAAARLSGDEDEAVAPLQRPGCPPVAQSSNSSSSTTTPVVNSSSSTAGFAEVRAPAPPAPVPVAFSTGYVPHEDDLPLPLRLDGTMQDWPGRQLYQQQLRRSYSTPNAAFGFDDDEDLDFELHGASMGTTDTLAGSDLGNSRNSMHGNPLFESEDVPRVPGVPAAYTTSDMGFGSSWSLDAPVGMCTPGVASSTVADAGPASPEAAKELVRRLGSALGSSVRMRSEGSDAASMDLLALDRQIALVASRLYTGKNPLLSSGSAR